MQVSRALEYQPPMPGRRSGSERVRFTMRDLLVQDRLEQLMTLVERPRSWRPATAVAFHDPADPDPLSPGAIVLAVGITTFSQVRPMLESLDQNGASALVVGPTFELEDGAGELAARSVALLRIRPSINWHRVSQTLNDSLRRGYEPPARSKAHQELRAVREGDLVELANAVWRLTGAPVTIEDRGANVLAFSEQQGDTDRVRIASILERRRAEGCVTVREASEAMRAILASERPVFIKPTRDAAMILPRVAVAIRSEGEVLGTIWAVVREPPGPDVEEILLDASHVAATHLRLSDSYWTSPHLVDELLSQLLDDGGDPRQAAVELGVAAPCVVLAVDVRDAPDRPGVASSGSYLRRTEIRHRIASALSLHLMSTAPSSVVAELGGRVYAVVPGGATDRPRIEAACTDFVDRVRTFAALRVGIGRVARQVIELPRSRLDADSTVRVLADVRGDRRVARSEDLVVEALLYDLRDVVLAEGRGPSGACARLLEYDRTRKSALVPTFRAWHEAHGDITEAAKACGVHPNTLRYRLSRISAVGGFELGDPRARFDIALQLRLFLPDGAAWVPAPGPCLPLAGH